MRELADARECYEARHCLRYIYGIEDCDCWSCREDVGDDG